MGLRMDLHNPSVPSALLQQNETNGAATRETVMDLIRRKDGLEAELEALGGVLESVSLAKFTAN